MKIKTWNIERVTGYKPKTTYYEDFSIADRFGLAAVKDTHKRVMKHIDSMGVIYLTELVLVLNWKIWEHNYSNDTLAIVYNDLWDLTREYALEHLEGEDLQYYLETTD
jgi:hypothetical protein